MRSLGPCRRTKNPRDATSHERARSIRAIVGVFSQNCSPQWTSSLEDEPRSSARKIASFGDIGAIRALADLADLPKLAARISRELSARGIRHVVSGAAAMAAHGYLRATRDI